MWRREFVKRTAPAQILISRPVYEAASKESDLRCNGSASSRSMAARKRKTYLKSPGPTPKPIAKCVSGWQALRASRRATKSCHKLGTGGMGVVYKALRLGNRRNRALKILKPEIATDPAVQENFKRELCLARKNYAQECMPNS